MQNKDVDLEGQPTEVKSSPKQSNCKGIPTERVCVQGQTNSRGVASEGKCMPALKKSAREGSECVTLKNPGQTLVHGHITNHRKLGGLKQHPLASPQFCRLETQHNTATFSAQGLTGTRSPTGAWDPLPHSSMVLA